PHYMDRFHDVRQAIKARVRDALRAVYQAEDEQGQPLYDVVGVMAHSLGAVVAYDAINYLFNEDDLGEPLKAIDRTAVLLTFGSPLDKTAFVFHAEERKASALRGALAASVQPLIGDYEKFRKGLTWINIWSDRDIISGPLDFYDDESNPHYHALKVRNLVDDQARLPLVAHVQYWKNDMIWERFWSAMQDSTQWRSAE
ncbi:MAG: hypothetical protein O3A51_12505, partial [Verrucomicrobia bacterium]|nr:hypothetical protein [Verrucomicrobiota bacterium]